MRALTKRFKPAKGFAPFFHLGLTTLLPFVVYILVRIDFFQLALAVVLLSKWRVLVVRPRYWSATLRANAIDIMVGISILIFMGHTSAASGQLLWVAIYEIWLVIIKPGSNVLSVSAQAFLGQLAALTALFIGFGSLPLIWLVLLVGGICYAAARHFFSSFDERLSALLSGLWAYFGAALAWALAHWLLFFGDLAQITLLLSVISLGLGSMYYLHDSDKLSLLIRRYLVYTTTAIVVVILVLSDWGDKAI